MRRFLIVDDIEGETYAHELRENDGDDIPEILKRKWNDPDYSVEYAEIILVDEVLPRKVWVNPNAAPES